VVVRAPVDVNAGPRNGGCGPFENEEGITDHISQMQILHRNCSFGDLSADLAKLFSHAVCDRLPFSLAAVHQRLA
jgi:hypothetical protein